MDDTLSPAVGFSDVLMVVLGLALVIGMIFLASWLMRRVSHPLGSKTSFMKIVSVMPIGHREKVLLVEVGETQLLLGVTSQSIQCLHVLGSPVQKASEESQDVDFVSRLQAMLSKSTPS